MFIVIAFMFAGGILGFLLRKKKFNCISYVIMTLICLLLFIIGIEVGANPDIISGFSTIGLEAFIITIAAVIGSSIMALLLWRYIKRK